MEEKLEMRGLASTGEAATEGRKIALYGGLSVSIIIVDQVWWLPVFPSSGVPS